MPPWIETFRNRLPFGATPIIRNAGGGAAAFNAQDPSTWPSGTELNIDSGVGYFPNPPAVRSLTRFFEMDGFSDPYEIRTVEGNFALADQATWPRPGVQYTYRIRGLLVTGNITYIETQNPGADAELWDGSTYSLPWQESVTNADLYVHASLSLTEAATINMLVEIIEGIDPDPDAPADQVFIYNSTWTPFEV